MISSRNCLLKFPVETWNFPPKIPPDYKTSYCICLSKCVQECLEKYMFVKLLITTFVIDRSSMLSTHAPKAFQVNYCLSKLAPKLLKEFLFPFRRLFIKRILGTPDIGALIKYFPRFQIILWKKTGIGFFLCCMILPGDKPQVASCVLFMCPIQGYKMSHPVNILTNKNVNKSIFFQQQKIICLACLW